VRTRAAGSCCDGRSVADPLYTSLAELVNPRLQRGTDRENRSVSCLFPTENDQILFIAFRGDEPIGSTLVHPRRFTDHQLFLVEREGSYAVAD
jgi:hypothetical protein